MYFETGSDSEFSVNRHDMIIHEIIISLKKALKRVRTLGKRVTVKVNNRTIFAINFLFLNIKSLISKQKIAVKLNNLLLTHEFQIDGKVFTTVLATLSFYNY